MDLTKSGNDIGLIINNEFKPMYNVSIEMKREYEDAYLRGFPIVSINKRNYVKLTTHANNPTIKSDEIDIKKGSEYIYKVYELIIKLQGIMNNINIIEEYIATKRKTNPACFMDADYDKLEKYYDDLKLFKDSNPDVDVYIEYTLYGCGDVFLSLKD